MEQFKINEFKVGNSIEGFYTLRIKEMYDELINALNNMEENHKLYKYYTSVKEYNEFCGNSGVFLCPLEFNKNMNLFKYQHLYNLTIYNRIEENDKIPYQDIELLDKVNNYVSTCIGVYYRTDLTYCFSCKKKMLKASMRRHIKTARHYCNVNKEL